MVAFSDMILFTYFINIFSFSAYIGSYGVKLPNLKLLCSDIGEENKSKLKSLHGLHELTEVYNSSSDLPVFSPGLYNSSVFSVIWVHSVSYLLDSTIFI